MTALTVNAEDALVLKHGPCGLCLPSGTGVVVPDRHVLCLTKRSLVSDCLIMFEKHSDYRESPPGVIRSEVMGIGLSPDGVPGICFRFFGVGDGMLVTLPQVTANDVNWLLGLWHRN